VKRGKDEEVNAQGEEGCPGSTWGAGESGPDSNSRSR